jgi:hypothetical protein
LCVLVCCLTPCNAQVRADHLDVLVDQETLCLLLVKLDDFLRQIKGAVVDVGTAAGQSTRAIESASTEPTAAAAAAAAAPALPSTVEKIVRKVVDRSKDFTAIDAIFGFDRFQLTLRSRDVDMASLAIEGLSATLKQMDQGDMDATAKLSMLSLKEKTVDPKTHHSVIATLGGSSGADGVFDLKFAQ